jgi:hypothetical protein
MGGAHGLREQDLDGLPEDLLAGVPEEVLDRRVQVADQPLAVDYQDPVGGRLEDGPVLLSAQHARNKLLPRLGSPARSRQVTSRKTPTALAAHLPPRGTQSP